MRRQIQTPVTIQGGDTSRAMLASAEQGNACLIRDFRATSVKGRASSEYSDGSCVCYGANRENGGGTNLDDELGTLG